MERSFLPQKGQYGNLVILRHRNGYTTYYGHLSKINSNVRKGVRIAQGSLIGNVGATGLATGPHLHYEMRINDRPVNPLSIKIPRAGPSPGNRWLNLPALKPPWILNSHPFLPRHSWLPKRARPKRQSTTEDNHMTEQMRSS